MKGLGKFLLFLLLLGAAAFALDCYLLNKPPQEVWREQVEYIERQIEGAPPAPVAQPRPIPAPVAPVLPPKPVAPLVKAPPVILPPDPLSWARDHEDLAPQEVT